jgi:hypothetical protein
MDDPMVTLITVLPATSTVGNGDFKQWSYSLTPLDYPIHLQPYYLGKLWV